MSSFQVEDLTISDTEKGGNSKKKFFKAVKAKDKKVTTGAFLCAYLNNDQIDHVLPQ